MKSLFLNHIVYYIAGLASVAFVLSYFQPGFFQLAVLILVCLGVATAIDIFLVYSKKNGVIAERRTTERFSIGDPNKVTLWLDNRYPFTVHTSVIDELPVQFQERNWLRKSKIESNTSQQIEYMTPS